MKFWNRRGLSSKPGIRIFQVKRQVDQAVARLSPYVRVFSRCEFYPGKMFYPGKIPRIAQFTRVEMPELCWSDTECQRFDKNVTS